ncbi:MAG: hypothetical protein DCC46_03980 [Armatimonadetes bacterium]|nr:MAG: hypothetical protein DCC46_03980 [Armatimonadota bacterium]
MSGRRGERIMGVETEFGCLVADKAMGTPESAVELLKDYVFYDLKLGAIDLHSRDDVFEPVGCGGFLLNGGRLYIDAVGSHLEYATAESRSLRDLVANDRAGQRILVRAIREMGLSDDVDIYNNSVDHFGGHTFGCHENYSISAEGDVLGESVDRLLPFLVTRQIYAGVGRVGGHVLTGGVRPDYQDVMEHPIDYIWVSQIYGVVPDDSVRFQLSQRADHILKAIASRVRFNRALINPKWEHFYSHEGTTRLHLLFGESNQMEYAYALKVGTTRLVLQLLEEGRVPERWVLKNPLRDLRAVSRDPDFRWIVTLADGTSLPAVDLHREYLALAQRYAGESEDADWTLREWEATLDQLESNPLQLSRKLDWVAKRKVIESYLQETGLDWGDESLHSVDLEYHNIDPSKGLYHALAEMGEAERFVSEADIVAAMTEPPPDTRAKGRGALVRKVLSRRTPKYYLFDWNGAAIDQGRYVEMPDPFETYEDAAQ